MDAHVVSAPKGGQDETGRRAAKTPWPHAQAGKNKSKAIKKPCFIISVLNMQVFLVRFTCTPLCCRAQTVDAVLLAGIFVMGLGGPLATVLAMPKPT